MCQPDSGEQVLDVLETLVRSGALDVAVVDSLPALVPRAELDGEMGEHHTGAYGRLMAQAMRKLAGAIAKTGTVVVFCNQLRESPGILFGDPERTPGGRAIKHQATIRLDVRLRDHLKDGSQVIGSRIRVKVVKNKVAAPFRSAELDLLLATASPESGLLDLGLDHGRIRRTSRGLHYQQTRLGHGRDQARQFLIEHPELAAQLHQQLTGHCSSTRAAS